MNGPLDVRHARDALTEAHHYLAAACDELASSPVALVEALVDQLEQALIVIELHRLVGVHGEVSGTAERSTSGEDGPLASPGPPNGVPTHTDAPAKPGSERGDVGAEQERS